MDVEVRAWKDYAAWDDSGWNQQSLGKAGPSAELPPVSSCLLSHGITSRAQGTSARGRRLSDSRGCFGPDWRQRFVLRPEYCRRQDV